MPIGKSAIKRVADNGYSKVKTAAPDMENSTVIAKPDPQVEEKLLPKIDTKKTAAKKPAAKTAPKTEKKAAAPKKPIAKKPATEKDGFERVGLGEKLPVHLL